MPRTKKSRKPGLIGTPKTGQKASTAPPKKKNTHKGKASGSRNSLLEKNQVSRVSKGTDKDKRMGSKKKIDLLTEKKDEQSQKPLIPKFKSPVDELDYIENDKKLQALLDKLDSDISVSGDDQNYVDTLLARHRLLCDLLGMKPEEDDEEPEKEGSEDLLDRLEKEYKF